MTNLFAGDNTEMSVRARLRQLHPLVPNASDALITVLLDSRNIIHASHYSTGVSQIPTACTARYPARSVVVTLKELLDSPNACTNHTCVPAMLEPSSDFSKKYMRNTDYISRLALNKFTTYNDRVCAIVEFLWLGNNNALPPGEYKRLMSKVYMPELNKHANSNRTRPQVLVALTARDIYSGRDDNASMYNYIISAAANNVYYVSKRNSVWLLLVDAWPTRSDYPSGQWHLGTILSTNVSASDLSYAICEVFTTLCDDALSGSSDWADIHEFYKIALTI